MSDTNESVPAPAAHHSPAREWLDIARTIGVALLVALVLRVVLFQPFTIPSDSMEATLLRGDYLIVSKYSYGWSRFSLPLAPPLFQGRLFGRTAHRGDVVVFTLTRDGRRTAFVKRVIGLPGDHVRLDRGVLILNGQAVKREILGPATDPDNPARAVVKVRETLPDGRGWTTLLASPDAPGETTDEYVVPAGRLFVMGDNRDNSLDSRWPEGVGMGFVPQEALVGRVRLVLMSWRGGADLLRPWTCLTRLDFSRALHTVR